MYVICLEPRKYKISSLYIFMLRKRNKTNYCKMKIIISLFSQVYQEVENHKILTVNNVKRVLQNKFPHANIWDILGIDSKYDGERKVSWNANF